MSPQHSYRNRCNVCRGVLDRTFARVYITTRGHGSHQLLKLCRICWSALFEIAVEVAKEYR